MVSVIVDPFRWLATVRHGYVVTYELLLVSTVHTTPVTVYVLLAESVVVMSIVALEMGVVVAGKGTD
jgi:hypothetical protein